MAFARCCICRVGQLFVDKCRCHRCDPRECLESSHSDSTIDLQRLQDLQPEHVIFAAMQGAVVGNEEVQSPE